MYVLSISDVTLLSFVDLSMPLNPGILFTSRIYGCSFSLFFAGNKSTPTISPFTNSETFIDVSISMSVSSIDSVVAPKEALLLKSPFKTST